MSPVSNALGQKAHPEPSIPEGTLRRIRARLLTASPGHPSVAEGTALPDIGTRSLRPALMATLCVGVLLGIALLRDTIRDATDHPAFPVAWSAVCSVAALVVFVILLWRGRSVLWAAPLLALCLAFTAAEGAPIAFFEASFAGPAGSFVGQYLPVFMVSAVFGLVLDRSGCAASLALGLSANVPRARVPLVLAGVCALLTMGGVGVFVVAFSVFPIAQATYRRAQLPIELAPAAIALGAFTAIMTAVPGAPSLNNIIAAANLGTNGFASPGIGLVAAVVMAGFGGWWLVRTAAAAPEVTVEGDAAADEATVPFLVALAPLVVALVVNWLLTWALSSVDGLDMGRMGPTFWAIIVGLACGIATATVIGANRDLKAGLDEGSRAAIVPLLGTAVGFGFGASLAALPAAGALNVWLAENIHEPLLSSATSTALYSGIVGSSSGGLALWFEADGPAVLGAGVSPEMLHRIVALGSGTIDTLPHGAAIIALLSICRCTHARAYRDVFFVSVVGPTLGLLAALAVAGGMHLY